MPEFELNAWRFGFQLAAMIPVNVYRKWDVKVPRKKLLSLVILIIATNASNILFFTSAIFLPLGIVGIVSNTIMLSCNAIISLCVKSQRTLTLYLGSLVAVVGMFFMLQPDVIFRDAGLPPPPQTNWTSPCVVGGNVTESLLTRVDLPSSALGYLLVTLCSLCMCSIYYLTRSLVQDISPFTICTWTALVGTILSLIIMAITETPTLPHSVFCCVMLLAHCIGGVMISVLLPWCSQYLPPSLVAMISASDVLFLLILQYTVLQSVMPGLHNWLEVLGGILGFIGLIGGPVYQIIRDKETQSSASAEIEMTETKTEKRWSDIEREQNSVGTYQR